MNSEEVKGKVFRLGADICGIAPVSRFDGAPEGFHPCDVHPGCRSVVVFASRFPLGTLNARTNAPYTLVRNRMVDKVDLISFYLSDELERNGIVSVPIPSAEPYDSWDQARRHGRGILSLKHAGACAGLGVMGRNTLLINEQYGNMIWLGAVLLSVELEPDPAASYECCIDGCTVCLDACPGNALDGTTIDQKRCREQSVAYSDGGGWVLSCNLCRKVCPHHGGVRTIP
ncbi:MAG TPA: epoxyqueuosine reductase [Deltaproteobacteria bacterium]|nr:epoxyqueuosine reductase [Deltaproteobacteria bacterium]HPR55081.1 epoxyqueuosine reductase [Deltaproteobacteria bacterium]HXK48470.1 epoxyqueuosine reductase [Deltaproteobacteria bacterium]